MLPLPPAALPFVPPVPPKEPLTSLPPVAPLPLCPSAPPTPPGLAAQADSAPSASSKGAIAVLFPCLWVQPVGVRFAMRKPPPIGDARTSPDRSVCLANGLARAPTPSDTGTHGDHCPTIAQAV